jgi:hypothetical protein
MSATTVTREAHAPAVLANRGLDSISVTPDAFAGVVTRLRKE